MIRAYFFDWMKTLCDVKELSPDENLLTEEQAYDVATHDYSKLEVLDKFGERFYNKLIQAKFKLYEDSFPILSQLKKRGKSLAIVSNLFSITNLRIKREFNEIINLFDIVSLSPEMGFIKPDQRMFTETLNKLNMQKSLDIKYKEVMMVGDDLKNDINPALESGMQAKLICRPKQKLKDILELA